MKGLNLSATINALRILKSPTLILPHATVSSFDMLPYPLHTAFAQYAGKGEGKREVDIQAVVLDKDNCFAIPYRLEVFAPYKERFELLKKEFPGKKLLVVSNSSGTDDDVEHKEADLLSRQLGIPVLHHSTKKPGCYPEILQHFLSDPSTGVTRPDQIAVVGDRLFTDVVMANMMGSWAVWVRDGVGVDGRHHRGMFAGMERMMEGWVRRGVGGSVAVPGRAPPGKEQMSLGK